MQTNFFTALHAIGIPGNWRITIQTSENGETMIAVLFTPDQANKEKKLAIPPLTLRGTASDLDEGFLECLHTTAPATREMHTNVTEHLQALKTAEAAAKAGKEVSKQPVKTTDPKQARYDAIMKKVDALAAEQKYGQAIAALPKTEEFPDHAAAIGTRREELKKLSPALSLF
jgi:PRTRC genetic system protein E